MLDTNCVSGHEGASSEVTGDDGVMTSPSPISKGSPVDCSKDLGKNKGIVGKERSRVV